MDRHNDNPGQLKTLHPHFEVDQARQNIAASTRTLIGVIGRVLKLSDTLPRAIPGGCNPQLVRGSKPTGLKKIAT